MEEKFSEAKWIPKNSNGHMLDTMGLERVCKKIPVCVIKRFFFEGSLTALPSIVGRKTIINMNDNWEAMEVLERDEILDAFKKELFEKEMKLEEEMNDDYPTNNLEKICDNLKINRIRWIAKECEELEMGLVDTRGVCIVIDKKWEELKDLDVREFKLACLEEMDNLKHLLLMGF